jgi:hypothetical protein
MSPPRRSSFLDLLFVLVVGGAMCLAVYLLPRVVALRAVFALPFMLVGLGYVIMSALYGGELPEGSMQVLLVPALSIAGLILLALGLDAVKAPLDARTIAVASLALASIASVVAAARRRGQGTLAASVHPGAILRSRWVWSILIAAGVFAVLLTVLGRPLPDQNIAAYTALSSLRSGPSAITVEVQSSQLQTLTYRLEVLPANGDRTERTFTLAPGRQWSQTIAVGGPSRQIVNVRLYRADDPATIYRQVTLRP